MYNVYNKYYHLLFGVYNLLPTGYKWELTIND